MDSLNEYLTEYLDFSNAIMKTLAYQLQIKEFNEEKASNVMKFLELIPDISAFSLDKNLIILPEEKY